MSAQFYANTFDVRAIYRAKGDGTTDDTSAIQNAINAAQTAGGGVVWFPAGTYKVTGTTYALLITSDNVTLAGTGGGSVIAHASTTGDTLLIRKDATGATRNESITVRDLQFLPSVTKTAGNEISVFYAYNTRLSGLRFQNCFRDLQIGSTNSPSGDTYKFRPVFGFVRDVYGERCKNAILMMNCTDWWFNGMSFWNPDGAFATGAAGIVMDTNCQSCNFVNCDVIGPTDTVANSNAALSIQDTLGAGFLNTTANNQFVNCYFDSFGSGVVASNAQMFLFSNCWFSDRAGIGVTLNSTTYGFIFNACQIFACGSHGVSLNGFDHVISNSQIHANGHSTTGDGINVDTAARGFRIHGNRISNGTGGGYQQTSSQRYGINIASGADDFVVANNDCRTNSTGGINNAAGTGATQIVANNL